MWNALLGANFRASLLEEWMCFQNGDAADTETQA
jgi:hypothetical protein